MPSKLSHYWARIQETLFSWLDVGENAKRFADEHAARGEKESKEGWTKVD
ncbi:MAG: hypothetical protein ACM3JI_03980 [Anaerolineae bacterium]